MLCLASVAASAPEKSSFSFGSYAEALKARPDCPLVRRVWED